MRRFQAIGLFLLFLASDSLGQTSIRMPPTITKQPKKIILFRIDDAITLECQAEGTTNITAVFGSVRSYIWEKNGAQLNQNRLQNIKTGIGGTITIEPAISLDEGYYQCFATNEHGTAVSIVSYVHKVVVQSNSQPGVIVVTTITVREGTPFHIPCTTAKSFPKPFYGWEVASDPLDRYSQPVPLSQRIQLAENGNLYFAYAEASDDLNGKIYKCTAYNMYLDIKVGGSYTRVTVTRGRVLMYVIAPGGAANAAPTLGFSCERQIVGLVNGSVTLRCFFYGKPEPTISWNRPGNTLPRNRHSLNRNNTELIINNIMASDEGNYMCTASNRVGQASYTIQLSIETEPSFKSVADRPHNVNVSEGDTVTVHCNADAKPEADVVWLRNGKKITDAPTKYVISQDEKSLTVADVCLNCKDRGRATDIVVIQCNASNRHGYAFASGYINVFEKTQVEVEGETLVTVDIDTGTVEAELKCSVKYDSTTPVKWTWYKRELYGNISIDERLYERSESRVSIKEGSVKIRVDVENATVANLLLGAWRQHFGLYTCAADNGISQSNRTIELQQFIPDTSTAAVTVYFDVNHERSRTWLIAVIAIALVLIVFGLLVCFCFRLRRKRLKRNNLESETGNETDPRKRAAGNENSTLPDYDTIPYDDYAIIDDLSPIPPPLRVATIQSTCLTTTFDVSPSNEFIPRDMRRYEEPVDDAQPENTASSQHCSETQETNQYSGLNDQTTAEYLALYTYLKQKEESANDILPEDPVSNQQGEETQTTNEYLRLADRNSGAYLTLYTDLQKSEEQGRDDNTSF